MLSRLWLGVCLSPSVFGPLLSGAAPSAVGVPHPGSPVADKSRHSWWSSDTRVPLPQPAGYGAVLRSPGGRGRGLGDLRLQRCLKARPG